MRNWTNFRLLVHLEEKAGFQLEIKSLRPALGIPTDGFANQTDITKWQSALTSSQHTLLATASEKLAKLAVRLIRKDFPRIKTVDMEWDLAMTSYLVGGKKSAQQILERNPLGILRMS